MRFAATGAIHGATALYVNTIGTAEPMTALVTVKCDLHGLLMFVERNGGDGLRVLFPDAESGEDSPKYLIGGNLSGDASEIIKCLS